MPVDIYSGPAHDERSNSGDETPVVVPAVLPTKRPRVVRVETISDDEDNNFPRSSSPLPLPTQTQPDEDDIEPELEEELLIVELLTEYGVGQALEFRQCAQGGAL